MVEEGLKMSAGCKKELRRRAIICFLIALTERRYTFILVRSIAEINGSISPHRYPLLIQEDPHEPNSLERAQNTLAVQGSVEFLLIVNDNAANQTVRHMDSFKEGREKKCCDEKDITPDTTIDTEKSETEMRWTTKNQMEIKASAP